MNRPESHTFPDPVYFEPEPSNPARTQSFNHRPETLQDVMQDIWRARFYMLVSVLVFMACAAAFWMSSTPYYRYEMTVGPANPINGAEVSSLLADENLFALRYIAQRVGVSGSSDFARFENTYSGASVAAILLQDPRVRAGLAADHPFSFLRRGQSWDPPRLSEYIAKRVRLEPVGATPLRRMVYYHPDRDFGTYFLSRIHALTDAQIRHIIRAETVERVQYLQEAVNATANPEHRRALTTLLMEQERLRMLVSIDQPYAASVVEPAAPSSKPAWPDAILTFGAFFTAGLLIGWLFYHLRQGTQMHGA